MYCQNKLAKIIKVFTLLILKNLAQGRQNIYKAFIIIIIDCLMDQEKQTNKATFQTLPEVEKNMQIAQFNKHIGTNLSKHSQVYLLSLDFIKKWKEYVGYSNQQMGTYSQNAVKPVLNDDLVIEDSSFILRKESQNPYNVLTADDLEEKTISVSKQLIDVFANYEGTRIIRELKMVEGKLSVEYCFEKIKIIVVSESIIKEYFGKQIPIFNALISKSANIKQFRNQIKFWIEQYYDRVGIQKKKDYKNQATKQKQYTNLWVIEEDVLAEEALSNYKNIFNSNLRVFGSKVTNLNNVRQLEGFLTNQSIVFILEQVKIQIKQAEKDCCLYCQKNHNQSVSCFEFQKEAIPQKEIAVELPSSLACVPVGLRNVGNTCYINSILQVLFHTQSLKNYFVKNEFKNEINKQNTHGTSGDLSYCYSQLLSQTIKLSTAEIDPSDLKKIIGNKNHMFRSYMQQDSQQFLMCLIDLLHQDLKRSSTQEVSSINSKNENDETKNQDQFISKNDSIIIDLFGGQYSSTLHCLNCENNKIVYQPFLNFSLHIPQKELVIKLVFCAFNRQKIYYKIDLYIDSVDLHSIGSRLAKELNEQYHQKKFKWMNWKYGFTDVDKYNQDHLLEAFLKKEIICYELSQQQITVLSQENPQKFIVVFRRTHGRKELPANRPFWFSKQVTTKDVFKRVWQWLYKSTIEHRLDQKFSKASPIAIFAAHFIKDPPLQLSLILHPNGKGACYYQKPISINTKIFENITSTLKNMRYELQVNIDKLCQFCDTSKFGKVGTIQTKPRLQGHLTLEQCIEKFNCPQFLDDNTIACETCNKKSGITKSMAVNRISDYFIIHLKRFKQKLGMRFKNTRFIDFPYELDTSKYVQNQKQKSIYRLYGVVNHSGTLNSGHYTAYVRTAEKWYLLNDHIVSEVSQDSIVTENAYILFYQRQK